MDFEEIKGQDFELEGNHVWIGDYHRSEEVRFNARDLFPQIAKAKKGDIISLIEIGGRLCPPPGVTPHNIAELMVGLINPSIPAAISYKPGRPGKPGWMGKILR